MVIETEEKYFVHGKCHTDWPENDPWPPRCEGDRQLT